MSLLDMAPLQQGLCVQESQQEPTKVVSLVNMVASLPSVSITL